MRLSKFASLPGGYATELSFSPDGVTWACARAGIIQIWQQTQLLHEVRCQDYVTGPVQFAADGELVFAGPFRVRTKDGELQPVPPFHDRLGTGIEAGPLTPTQMAAQRAVFTPNGMALLVYATYRPGHGVETRTYHGPRERLVLLEVETEQLTVLWEGDGLSNCGTLGATNNHLAAAGREARLWSLQPLQLQGEYPAQRVQINTLRFSNDGNQFAYGDAAGQVTIREVGGGTSRDWLASPAGVSSLCFSADDERIFTGGRDGALNVWTNQQVPQPVGAINFREAVTALALSPDSRRLLVALGGRDQTIELYQVEDHGGA